MIVCLCNLVPAKALLLLVAGTTLFTTIQAQPGDAGYGISELTRRTDEAGDGIYVKPAAVTGRAVRDFTKYFKAAEHATWYRLSSGFMVNFFQAGVRRVCRYDLKGNRLYELVSLAADKLPRAIGYQVNNAYPAYMIAWINQVRAGGRTTWLIHLTGNKAEKNIYIENDGAGTMQEIKSH